MTEEPQNSFKLTIPIKQYWALLRTYLKPQWPHVLLLALLLAACTEPARKHHQDIYIFGTVMGVTLWAPNDPLSRRPPRPPG